MGAALDIRLTVPESLALSEPQPGPPAPVRTGLAASLLLHLLALACLPPLAASWQAEPVLPAVLQVTVAAGQPQPARQTSAAVPQPRAASKPLTERVAPVARPVSVPRPVVPLLAVTNAAPEAVAVSSAVADVKAAVPAAVPDSTPAGSRIGNAEAGEESAPARVDPAYRSLFKPVYPLSARRRGIEGTVLLRVEVLPSGEPGRVEIARSSGDESLDDSAREAARQLRFNPAQKGGKPVSGWANIPYQFKLEG